MLRGEITPCGFPGVLGGARVAEKKARGLRIGETENVGAVLMEEENSPRAPVSLPGGSVAPSPSFPFNSVKHSLFGLRLGNEILIAPLRTRISCCALPQPADSFFGFFLKKPNLFKKGCGLPQPLGDAWPGSRPGDVSVASWKAGADGASMRTGSFGLRFSIRQAGIITLPYLGGVFGR